MPNTKKTPKVVFNASVILSGIYSPTGGSAKVLEWVKTNKIKGVISEIIKDEVIRKSYKLKINPEKANKVCIKIFAEIVPSPKIALINKFENTVIDYGDTHLLATAYQTKSDYLLSLDKKHILSLKNKIKWTKIVSPGELIKILVK